MRGIDPLLPGGWWHDMSGKLARPLYTPFCRVRKEKYRCGTEIRPVNDNANVQSPKRHLDLRFTNYDLEVRRLRRAEVQDAAQPDLLTRGVC